MLTVAHGMENTNADIVHNCKDCAAEIITEINDGFGQDIRRGVHPTENCGRKGDTENGQQNAGGQTEGDVRMDGGAHILMILCAEEFCDNDTGAHGHTIEEANKHVNKAAGGTDCRKGGIADEFTYRPGVEGMVELLKNIAQKNRQGKKKDLLPDWSFCQ